MKQRFVRWRSDAGEFTKVRLLFIALEEISPPERSGTAHGQTSRRVQGSSNGSVKGGTVLLHALDDLKNVENVNNSGK